ncbi:hypothetical protein CsSME_00040099 [Camellia sinensis var. sinensis]
MTSPSDIGDLAKEPWCWSGRMIFDFTCSARLILCLSSTSNEFHLLPRDCFTSPLSEFGKWAMVRSNKLATWYVIEHTWLPTLLEIRILATFKKRR